LGALGGRHDRESVWLEVEPRPRTDRANLAVLGLIDGRPIDGLDLDPAPGDTGAGCARRRGLGVSTRDLRSARRTGETKRDRGGSHSSPDSIAGQASAP